MNKKGDIPVTILVIGVFAICLIAILSFYISDSKVKKDFYSIEIIEQAKILKDKIGVYEKLGFSEEEIKEVFNSTEGVEIELDGIGKHIKLSNEKVSVRYALP